jgi:hypothetical protein
VSLRSSPHSLPCGRYAENWHAGPNPRCRKSLADRFRIVGNTLGKELLGGTASALGRGTYVNFMVDEGEDRVQATYRGNYGRLAAIKAIGAAYTMVAVDYRDEATALR